jgi:tetratricopeptide (TPR) repeat protein
MNFVTNQCCGHISAWAIGGLLCMVATMALPPCRNALAEAVSQVVTEAEQAERARNYSRAIDLYSVALNDSSLSNEKRRLLLKKRAFVNEWANRADQAVADWSAALAIEPIDPAIYGSRGFFYLRTGRYDDALADFSKGTTLDTKNAFFPYGAGRVFSERQDYNAAVVRYTEAIRLDPDHGTAHLWRGEAYLGLKRYREARADFEKVFALGPLIPADMIRAYLGRGFAKVWTNDFEQGVSDLDRAIESQPENLNALRARGFAHEKLGNQERAVQDYQRVLNLDANDRWTADRLRALRKP